MESVQIRPAYEQDREEVLDLCRKMMAELAGEEQVEALLPVLIDETQASFCEQGDDVFFVAQAGDELIACGRAVIFPSPRSFASRHRNRRPISSSCTP